VRVVFVLTVLGGIGLLTLAMWPGMIENRVFEFPLFCASFPLLGCWFLLLVGLALRDLCARPEPRARRHQRWGVRSAGVMLGTLALLWLHVPQRAALAFCYADLGQLVEGAPAAGFRGEELGRQVGPYRVDRYATDERGGVFFRTATGADGIGPDEMSYGFAFRPNGRGAPFGNARYRQRHLFGDWYAFAASDDW
jgi:hypothetical protein